MLTMHLIGESRRQEQRWERCWLRQQTSAPLPSSWLVASPIYPCAIGSKAMRSQECSLGLTLILGMWRPMLLLKLLGLAEKGMNRLAKKVRRTAFFPDGWAARNAYDFSNAAGAIKAHPEGLALTLGLALMAHLINIFSLYALFIGFHQQIGFGPLVAGYSMGILFWNISPVPQGIGVVEGVIALVYTSLGIHGVIATLIVLAFRALNFWLPMPLGFVLLRRVKILQPRHGA